MPNLKRLLILASCASFVSACELPPILNPQIAELCRAHSNEVLIFAWEGERRVLPVHPEMTLEEDTEWRTRLNLPPYSRSPYPFNDLSYPISAVAQFGEGWLVGTDLGEWGGSLFFIQENEAPRQLGGRNVHALVPTNGGVYALFGLAHLGSDEGFYRLVSLSEDGPILGEERALPGSPIDIAQDNDATLIAGGFDRDGTRTWGRVFGQGEPVAAIVSSACP